MIRHAPLTTLTIALAAIVATYIMAGLRPDGDHRRTNLADGHRPSIPLFLIASVVQPRSMGFYRRLC